MLYYITCYVIQHKLYDKSYVMLYNMCCYCSVTCVMLCYITYVMLFYVML